MRFAPFHRQRDSTLVVYFTGYLFHVTCYSTRWGLQIQAPIARRRGVRRSTEPDSCPAGENGRQGVIARRVPLESPRSCGSALPLFRMNQSGGRRTIDSRRLMLHCSARVWNRPGNRTRPGMLHRNTGWMLTSGSWAPGTESRTGPSPRPDRRLRRGWLAGRSLAWYRVPGAPPIRVGIARVADRRADRRLRSPSAGGGWGSDWIPGGLSGCCTGLQHWFWRVGLVFLGAPAPPPGKMGIPAGSQRAARRFRRFRVEQSWLLPAREIGFAAGECP